MFRSRGSTWSDLYLSQLLTHPTSFLARLVAVCFLFLPLLSNSYIDFGWDKFDDATKLQKRAVELNNGRAAMMGILGLLVHEQLGGSLPIVGEM